MHLSAEQFIKAIDELSCSAAPGPDNFPAVFLKNCKTELAKPLCKVWTTSLCQGYVPYKLKGTIITPPFKSGSKGIAANYRPIALTSDLVKIFEKVVRNHLTKYMNKNSL